MINWKKKNFDWFNLIALIKGMIFEGKDPLWNVFNQNVYMFCLWIATAMSIPSCPSKINDLVHSMTVNIIAMNG